MLTCLNIYLLLVIKITLFLFKNYLTFPASSKWKKVHILVYSFKDKVYILSTRFCLWLTLTFELFSSMETLGSRSGRVKPMKICICCFSANHSALMSKDWLNQNQDNVFEWGENVYQQIVVSVSRHYKNLTTHLVKYKADIIIISSKCSLI